MKINNFLKDRKNIVIFTCLITICILFGIIAYVVNYQGGNFFKPEFLGDTSTSISISGSSSVVIGNTTTLTATVSDSLSYQPLTWRSMDSSIAIVENTTGKTATVTGVSTGTTTITAAIQGSSIQASFKITVFEDDVTKEIVIIGGPAVSQGQSITLKATVNPSTASQTVTWSSADTSIATINSSTGVLNGISPGSVTITARSDELDITSSIRITVISNSILINGERFVFVGKTRQLTATSPASSSITWSSLDTSKATVDTSTGVVTGVSPGRVTIKATSNLGSYELVELDVIEFGNISVNHEKLWLAKDGDSEDVTVSVTDSSGEPINGLDLVVTENRYTEVDVNDYKLTTKSLSIGEVTDNIKVCIKNTDWCTNYSVYIYCQKWTLVNSQRTFSLGYNLHDSHLNETCYYRDIDENSCEPIYTEDNVLKSYKCQSYYNRCCGGGTTPPVESEACYVKRVDGTDNTYCFGTSSTCSGFTEKLDGITASSCSETPACYQTSSGEYVTGSFSGQNGYTYIGATCPVTPPAEEPVCYVNQTTGDYQWSTTSPGEGYTIDSSITSESACITPELPACYKDASNNYVWGLYYNDANYTLVEDVLSEEDCHEKIDVPMTSSNVQNIIYVFVAILLTFGIYVIYYSYKKRKLNK